MKFKKAVEDAPAPVNKAYCKGLQALEKRHRGRVKCSDPHRLTGSVNLDKALARESGYANAPRWDYGIGYKLRNGPEQVVWVEVHPATTKEVSAVLKKLRWLRDWLNGEAEQLLQLTNATKEEQRYVWIASSSVKIPGNSPQARLLNKRGIRKVHQYLSLP